MRLPVMFWRLPIGSFPNSPMPVFGWFELAVGHSIGSVPENLYIRIDMIKGKVNENYEAIIPVVVSSRTGALATIDAIVDTGFTGSLTLPLRLVHNLGLDRRGYAQAILGDGSLHTFEVFRAALLWDGETRVVELDAAETDPLVGMDMIHGHEMRMEVVSQGPVTIERLGQKSM